MLVALWGSHFYSIFGKADFANASLKHFCKELKPHFLRRVNTALPFLIMS